MKITIEYLSQIQNSKNDFYVVTKGRAIGLYGDWESTSKQVTGFPKAVHRIVKGRYDAVKYLLDELLLRAETGRLDSEEVETLDSILKIIDIIKPREFPSLI